MSWYQYGLDTLGRRTTALVYATAVDNEIGLYHWDFGYNGRNELTGGHRRRQWTAGEGEEISPNAAFDYAYDPIGNRATSNVDDGQNPMAYTRNSVNQYTGTAYPTESFTYDDDGNLRTDGYYTYDWDAENRLIRIVRTRSGPSEINDQKTEFKYDYMGRRVEKAFSRHNGTDWVLLANQRFVYDQWNLVLVLDGRNDNRILRKHTWGLDLSGLAGNGSSAGIHGAGGIGGLLATVDLGSTTGSSDDASYWYFYDGNGNVVQLLDATNPAAMKRVAHYLYDPYGIAAANYGRYDPDGSNYEPDAGYAANTFQFSTKYRDTEMQVYAIGGAIDMAGLYYYGYRYYSPRLGRWISRDPIEELGGLNLYVFCFNNPAYSIDPLGESVVDWGLCTVACYLGLSSSDDLRYMYYAWTDPSALPREVRRKMELEARKILTGSIAKPTEEAVQKLVKELAEKRLKALLTKKVGAKVAAKLAPNVIPGLGQIVSAVMTALDVGQVCWCGYKCKTGRFY